MNPALVTRVHRTGSARPLADTVHSSFITFGVVLGSAPGGPNSPSANSEHPAPAPLHAGQTT